MRNRQAQGEGAAVFALALQLAVFAQDPFFTGAAVVFHVAVMLAAVGLGHQQGHVMPHDFFGGVAKHGTRRLVEGSDQTVRTDGDHSVRHVVENGLRVLQRCLQGIFCENPLCHVALHRHPVGEPAGTVGDGRNRQFYPKLLAALAVVDQLGMDRLPLL